VPAKVMISEKAQWEETLAARSVMMLMGIASGPTYDLTMKKGKCKH
jgi:hypothetical protein